VNAIVLWNTLYMEAALKQLQQGDPNVTSADVARLSLLVHRHINFQGR
jgi:Tn3 transposase DDE domain